MAVIYYRSLAGLQVQLNCATAEERTFAVEFPVTNVGSDPDALTITVSRVGAAFAATAGTTLTQISGATYKLVLAAGDIDTRGDLAINVAGTDDTTVYTGLQVVDGNPYRAIQDIRQASLFGKIVADTADNTAKAYEEDGVTLRGTATKGTSGTQTTWTPT